MTAPSTALTIAQYERALALASAFGHHWAAAVTDQNEPSPELAEARNGLAACVAAGQVVPIAAIDGCSKEHPNAVGGIFAPTLSTAGQVVHTTATGRLTWAIEADGEVALTIRRPSNARRRLAAVREEASAAFEATLAVYERASSTTKQRMMDVALRNSHCCGVAELVFATPRGRAADAALHAAEKAAEQDPSCLVLAANVPPGGDVVFYNCGGEPFFERHVQALEEALVALLTPERSRECTAALHATALADSAVSP
jgi:hypothetical protein